MLTAFDVGVGILVLISAILATARGLTREVLSLATWAGSAAIAAYLYFNHQDLIYPSLINDQLVAQVALVIVSFIVSLIVLHLFTMWIADFVVDSKIGPLDRTLGFIFGVARGVIIAIVVVIFGQWLLGPNLPSWAAESRSMPVLEGMGDTLIAALPEDLEKQVTDILQQRGLTGDETPADQAPAEDEGTDALEDGTPPAGGETQT
jgi:membrane protein required for colicin V production